MARFRLPLRFSLRTLFVVVALICLYLGWQWRIVQERKALLAWMGAQPSVQYRFSNAPIPAEREVSFVRRLFGDKTMYAIFLGPLEKPMENERIRQIHETFREAEIFYAG